MNTRSKHHHKVQYALTAPADVVDAPAKDNAVVAKLKTATDLDSAIDDLVTSMDNLDLSALQVGNPQSDLATDTDTDGEDSDSEDENVYFTDGGIDLELVLADCNSREFDLHHPGVHFFQNYDWRFVMYMRYGTHVMKLRQHMDPLLKWDDLAEMFQQPMVDLRAYCKKAMDYLRANWLSEELDLRLVSEILPQKKRMLVPLVVQRLVTS
jgi:hypothetical protein